MEQKIVKKLKTLADFSLLALMALPVVSLLLGTGHLLMLFYDIVASPDPCFGLVNVDDLYAIFSVSLILGVGMNSSSPSH